MALKSMTGFGAAQRECSDWALRVEIKSVNHKSLDVRINAPRDWGLLEAPIMNAIRERIRRGRLTLTLEAAPLAASAGPLLGVDEARLEEVIAQLRGIQARHGLGSTLTLSDLEPYRAQFSRRHEDTRPLLWEELEPVVVEALEDFDAARRSEGETIHRMFLGHVAQLREVRAQLIALRPVWLEGYAERLRARLLELSRRHALELDEGRVIQEVNHFAERTDLSEELQRAGAHLDRLEEVLAVSDEPHGKKLDFYLQELIRETNTMASKSNVSDLTRLVVEMKAWIEQLREQAANVE